MPSQYGGGGPGETSTGVINTDNPNAPNYKPGNSDDFNQIATPYFGNDDGPQMRPAVTPVPSPGGNGKGGGFGPGMVPGGGGGKGMFPSINQPGGPPPVRIDKLLPIFGQPGEAPPDPGFIKSPKPAVLPPQMQKPMPGPGYVGGIRTPPNNYRPPNQGGGILRSRRTGMPINR
jgi:hypothetical protein